VKLRSLLLSVGCCDNKRLEAGRLLYGSPCTGTVTRAWGPATVTVQLHCSLLQPSSAAAFCMKAAAAAAFIQTLTEL
jgi:hypothetical protein